MYHVCITGYMNVRFVTCYTFLQRIKMNKTFDPHLLISEQIKKEIDCSKTLQSSADDA